MRITLESTTEIGLCNTVPARVWHGQSESGVPVVAFITRLAVPPGHDAEAFERELVEAPTETEILNSRELAAAVRASCEHDLACRKCGASIGEIGLAAAGREDEEMAAALDAANEEIAAQLVTTVRVEPCAGVHEGVTVWLRGANVGTLTVGAGEGEKLRGLLLSETIVAKARTLVQHWKDQDGFNASVVDDLMGEIDLVDQTVMAERRSEATS